MSWEFSDQPLIFARPMTRSRLQALPVSFAVTPQGMFGGGILWAINGGTSKEYAEDGDTVTVRCMVTPHHWRDLTIDYVTLRRFGAGNRLGDALACRLEGDDLDAMRITHVRNGIGTIGDTPSCDQVHRVRQGVFAPSLLNSLVRGITTYQDGN